jgi:hypothetical protein
MLNMRGQCREEERDAGRFKVGRGLPQSGHVVSCYKTHISERHVALLNMSSRIICACECYFRSIMKCVRFSQRPDDLIITRSVFKTFWY